MKQFFFWVYFLLFNIVLSAQTTKPIFTEMGDGLNGQCHALAAGPGDIVYAGGEFTQANHISANRIARWNGSWWSALGGGVDNVCKAIAVDKQGHVYAGGNFIRAGGILVNHIARWQGEYWESLGPGLPSNCDAIAIDQQGNVYAGGYFTKIGELTVNYVAKWDPAQNAWFALGIGLPSICHALVFDADGNLYAGGQFGVSKWNSSTSIWEPVGSFNGSTDCRAIAITTTSPKKIYAGGNFGVKWWNGTNWADLPNLVSNHVINGECYALALSKSNDLFITGKLKIGAGVKQHGLRWYNGSNQAKVDENDIWTNYTGDAGWGNAACTDNQGGVIIGGYFPVAVGRNITRIIYSDKKSFSTLLDAVSSDKDRVDEDGKLKDYRAIFIQNYASDNTLIKVYRGAQQIGHIQSPSNQLWAVPVRQGESISFELPSSTTNKVVSPLSIAVTSQNLQNFRKYDINIVTPYSSSNAAYTHLPNKSASECSFDIYKIPPAKIDMPQGEGGGIRQQIFKGLQDGDVIYTVDGNVPLKPHFSLSVARQSSGTQNTSSVYGAQNFKRSLAANIEVGVPIEGIGVEAKYGFSASTESSIANEEVFTLSRVDGTEYSIDLVLDQIDLTDAFVAAVVALPVPTSNYNSVQSAKKDPGWEQYRNTFITKWGTHFPTQVVYGGYYWGIKTSSFEQVIASTSFEETAEASINAAEVAKVGGGVSTGTTSGTESKVSQEKIFFEQLGGAGNTFDNWNSDMSSARAVGISLSSLEELLIDNNFKDKIKSQDLAKKKAMLKWALKDYGDSKPKYESTAPSIEIYELTPQSIVFEGAESDGYFGLGRVQDDVVEVFGKVDVKVGKYNSTKKDIDPDDIKDVITIWDVPSADKISFHSKNDLPKSMELTNKTPLRFYLKSDPSTGKINRNDYGFAIYVHKIWEHDNIGTDEEFTKMKLVWTFNGISEEKKDMVFKLEKKKWEIYISAKVQRLPLSTIGLKNPVR